MLIQSYTGRFVADGIWLILEAVSTWCRWWPNLSWLIAEVSMAETTDLVVAVFSWRCDLE